MKLNFYDLYFGKLFKYFKDLKNYKQIIFYYY